MPDSGTIQSQFAPPALLRGRHRQSILAGWPPRRPLVKRRAKEFLEASTDVIVDCGEGVRLLTHQTPAVKNDRRSLAVFIHGWEGSADSMYVLSAASRLWRDGYDVCRLNLRDHGESHHLNEKLFHSCRLREAIGAVVSLQQRGPNQSLNLVGFSLGGNFALRIAADGPSVGLKLQRVVAICPVLDPVQTLDALENGWMGYRNYFIRKWRKSLVKKMHAFPDTYNFSNLTNFRSLRDMTDHFVTTYTEFPDLHTYLRGYALTGSRLAELEIPSTMLLAEDDPVIPIAGLNGVARAPSLIVERSAFGGHCGFLADYRLRSWLDEYVLLNLQG